MHLYSIGLRCPDAATLDSRQSKVSQLLAVRVRSKQGGRRVKEFRFVVKSCHSFYLKLSSEKDWSRPNAVVHEVSVELFF